MIFCEEDYMTTKVVEYLRCNFEINNQQKSIPVNLGKLRIFALRIYVQKVKSLLGFMFI